MELNRRSAVSAFGLLLSFLTVSFAVVGCKKSQPPADHDAALPALGDDQGLIVVRFPDAPASAYVRVVAPGFRANPATFPTSVVVPLGSASVFARACGYRDFDQGIMLNPAARRAEVEIQLRSEPPDNPTDYCLSRSELLQTEAGFRPLAQRTRGTPRKQMFSERCSGGDWRSTLSNDSSLLIDEAGDVWFTETVYSSKVPGGKPPRATQYFKVGLIETEVFGKMAALRKNAVDGDVAPVCPGSCVDCGGSGCEIIVDVDDRRVRIASSGQNCALGTTAAARTLTAWMVAIGKKLPAVDGPPASKRKDG